MFNKQIQFYTEFQDTPLENQNLYPFWKIVPAKSGELTAIDSQTEQKLHSGYAPKKEAQNLISTAQNDETLIFEAFGLGYSVVLASEIFPFKNFVIIEPEPSRFFASLCITDWENVFKIQNLTLALSCTPEQIITLLNQFSFRAIKIFSVKSQISHAEQYFSAVDTLIKRNIEKQKINEATLERFGELWISNSLKNLKTSFLCRSILPYKNSAEEKIPFTIIAAGPSLQKILPFLAEIKKRSVLVCVDTALKACLYQNVEPDFIILTDPQYWAFRHISDLKSESSILITEASVVPQVFRFKCKEILVCKSNFFLEQYFENLSFQKGTLESGGSVASTAWNFCEFSGAKEIFISGLDLSFPQKNTHIKGSQFEQKIHAESLKIASAQTKSLPLLFSANTQIGFDYNGKKVLTDNRMKMFAWWFESRLQKFPEIKTFTLSKESLKIPGIIPCEICDILSKNEIPQEKSRFLSLYKTEQKHSEQEFFAAIKIFNSELEELKKIAEKNALESKKLILQNALPDEEIFQTLQNLENSFLTVAAQKKSLDFMKVLFPTEKLLKQKTEQLFPESENFSPLKKKTASFSAKYDFLAEKISNILKKSEILN